MDLFAAIGRRNMAKVGELLEGMPTWALQATNDQGQTPLMFAAYKGCVEAVRLMLAKGADPCTRDRDQATPLHWAAIGGEPGIVDALVAAGAQVDALDAHSLTPLQLAVMRGRPAAAEALRRHGATEAG